MPIYLYHCPKCGKEWEARHAVKDRGKESCCGKKALIAIAPTSKPVVYEYFCKGMGEMVRGPKHRMELMRQKGLEERG